MKRWALLLGRKGTGRSSAASRVARELAERGIAVGGILQEAIEDAGEIRGYRVRRVRTGESAPLARRGVSPRGAEDEAFCSLAFDRRGFAAARRWIEEDSRSSAVIVLDGVSSLEAAGNGHHDAIHHALAESPLAILVVRAEELYAVMERFALDEPLATLETSDPDGLVAFVETVTAAAASPR